MKIRIEIDENLTEEELVIRCPDLSEEVWKLQRAAQEISQGAGRFAFYQGETEYYLPLSEILFFETDGGTICAHTARDVYHVYYRLYELEELLPGHFLSVRGRISHCGEARFSLRRRYLDAFVFHFAGRNARQKRPPPEPHRHSVLPCLFLHPLCRTPSSGGSHPLAGARRGCPGQHRLRFALWPQKGAAPRVARGGAL